MTDEVGRKGGGEAASGGRLADLAWAGWLRPANALQNATNAVRNATAFAGATAADAIAATELLAKGGGGRGRRRRRWRRSDGADVAAIASAGWLRLANTLPNAMNAVFNDTIRNATARNGTLLCRALDSLISKPGARDHKEPCLDERSRETSQTLRCTKEQKDPFCPALRPPIGVST